MFVALLTVNVQSMDDNLFVPSSYDNLFVPSSYDNLFVPSSYDNLFVPSSYDNLFVPSSYDNLFADFKRKRLAFLGRPLSLAKIMLCAQPSDESHHTRWLIDDCRRQADVWQPMLWLTVATMQHCTVSG